MKVEPPSVEWKVKSAEVDETVPEGPVSITVLGAAVSIAQVRVAGEASVLPKPSLALTRNVWAPSDSAV